MPETEQTTGERRTETRPRGILRRFTGGFRDNEALATLVVSLFLLQLGSSMTQVAIPLLAADRYGFGLAVGIALGIRLVPTVLLSAVAGYLIERIDPRRVAVWSSVSSAAVVALFPLTTELWQLYVLSFLTGITYMFGVPAWMALRPQAMKPGAELEGNSSVVTAERTTMLLGPALAAAIATSLGLVWLFAAEAASAAAAAVLILRIPLRARDARKEPGKDREGTAGGTAAVVRKTIQGAFVDGPRDLARAVGRDRFLLGLTITSFTYVFAVALGRTFLIAATAEWFPEHQVYGYALAAMGAGGIVGGFLGGRLGRFHAGKVYVLGNALEGFCWLAMPFLPLHGALYGLLFLAGFLESVASVVYFAEVQRRLPDQHMGRYFAALIPLLDVCTALGLTIGAPLTGSAGLTWVAAGIFALITLPVVVGYPVFGRAPAPPGAEPTESTGRTEVERDT
ncbi:MFS transporter [Sphaerisporangium album]|uniref:MFS transporter n=1 Tax=Sphaerisporangium album TaxID=509200 RepID=UPI0015F0A890|nr:MFS transporter [Sphaerisporangium album]